MKEVVDYIDQIRTKLSEYGDWLDKFNNKLFNGFNAIFNGVTLTLELLNFYYEIWGSCRASGSSPEEVENLRRENAERVIMITKWAFVHAMSIIEFSIKNAVKIINPSILKSIEKRKSSGGKRVFIYLRDIVEELKKKGCICEKVYRGWDAVINIRNLVVHNNAIADRNKVLHVGDLEIELKEGEMVKRELDFFVMLIDHAVENYKRTLEALQYCKF